MKTAVTTSILAMLVTSAMILTACVGNNDTQNANPSISSKQQMQFAVTHISTDKSTYTISEPIILSMQVKNTGTQPLTFLPWGTPIENSLTGNSLKVIYNNSEAVEYSGIMVKRRPPIKTDYITLQLNQTATGKINVLDGYKLDKKGTYSIQFNKGYSNLPTSNAVTIEVK